MRYAGVLVGLLVTLGACAPAWGHGRPEPPQRVLIIVLDQLRPDLVNTFDMRNVKALMRDGASFDNAYLGHMASETVISHNVITSGQLPRDMGWADEAFRDSDDVLGADPTVEDGLYHGTPAGWAEHGGHEAARALLLP